MWRVILGVLLLAQPAAAATITSDEDPALYTPGFHQWSVREELNLFYEPYGVSFSSHEPFGEVTLLWTGSSYALVPAERRLYTGAELYLDFHSPVDEVFGLAWAMGVQQPSIVVRAFNDLGAQIGADLPAGPFVADESWRFTVPDGQKISRIEFVPIDCGGGGAAVVNLEQFTFVPEPTSLAMIVLGLCALVVMRRGRS